MRADARPSLFFVCRRGDEPPELTASRPNAELAAELNDVVRGHLEEFLERELIPYGPATEVGDGQVMWVPAATVPLLAEMPTDDEMADLALFDPGSKVATHLRLSAMRVGSDGGPITLYRSVRRGALLAKSRKIAILRSGSDMVLVKPDKAVLIDRGVDAIVVGGVALFVDRKAFQRVFGFLEQIQAAAAATFDEVARHLRIDGMEDLRAAATTQLAMLGKMASIARKLNEVPGYREALTMEALVAFVRANPHTGVEIEGDGEQAHLVFRTDAQHRFKILKLLDDDYLRSQLTQLEYEANSKSAPLS